MAASVKALVTPALLTWARDTAGLSLEEAADKLQINPERLDGWEQGSDQPTLSQLRKLSLVYKRSLAAFYLPQTPEIPPPIRDFRRLPGSESLTESPALRLEIRRAYERRSVAVDLYEELGEEPLVVSKEISLQDNPEVLGREIRKFLGLTYANQITWKDPYKAFNWWRAAIEARGILVFQATGVAIGEMRGFSIHDRPLPIIAVNIKDRPRGRIFSMLHELAHILVREGCICTLHESHLRTAVEQRVEIFCNRVAGATLVPKEYLELEEVIANRPSQMEWSDKQLATLSYRYQASRETILRRLLTLGYTTESFYQQKRKEFQKEYKSLEEKKSSIVVQQHQKAVSSAGPTYTRLVLEGYY